MNPYVPVRIYQRPWQQQGLNALPPLYADDDLRKTTCRKFNYEDRRSEMSRSQYCINYRLKPSPSRTDQLLPPLGVMFDGVLLNPNATLKYLGITLHRTLDLKNHLTTTAQNTITRNNILQKLADRRGELMPVCLEHQHSIIIRSI